MGTEKKWRWGKALKYEFITLLSALLKNGFTLQETLPFMKIVLPKAGVPINLIEEKLLEGKKLSVVFREVGFDEYEETILFLAEVHGDFIGSFELIGERIQSKLKRQQQLLKVLAYPLLLLCFLLGILLSLRHLILPQVTQSLTSQNNNIGYILIQKGPEFFGSLSGIILLGLLIFYLATRKLGKLERFRLLSKVPLIGYYVKYMMTAFFANEIGKLLSHGLEMKAILLVLDKFDKESVAKAFSGELMMAYKQGVSWSETIAKMPFLRKEFSQIILRGEAKGKVGSELILYSERLWHDLNKKNEKAIMWVQPVIFLGIALIILSVYGALLLPIYSEMEEVF